MPERFKWWWPVALIVVTVAGTADCRGASSQAGAPDLSKLSSEDRDMIDSACSSERTFDGPAAYYACVRKQLAAMPRNKSARGPVAPDAPSSLQIQAEAAKIAVVLKEDEVAFCQETRDPACHTTFVRGIRYRPVTLSPSGQRGLIVELSVPYFCGSGGCSIYVLRQKGNSYSTVLEELGSLDGFDVAESTSKGFFDITRIGKASSSRYRWTGSKYIAAADEIASDAAPTPLQSESPRSSSSDTEVSAWVFIFLVGGALLGFLYRGLTKRRCTLCGNPPDASGVYCSTCSAAMSEAAKRASEERAAEERAKVEEQRRAQEKEQQKEQYRPTTLADLHQLTGPQFEHLIASLFRKDGYAVNHCGGSGDEGVDLILIMGEEKDVVQCKRWRNDIGSPVLRDFYGALMHAVARHGFIITTAFFTQGARDFARGKPISLISGSELLRWINGTYSSRSDAGSRSSHNDAGSRSSSTNRAPVFDAYVVLGVNRNASPEEIRAAYRREMSNYHPDKVAHLGKDLQDLAKIKAQEINRAYEELTRHS